MKSIAYPKIDRGGIYSHFAPDKIVDRYQKNYRLNLKIDFEKIKFHAALEGELTDLILSAAPQDRVQVSAQAYERLYRELPWLVGTGTNTGAEQWRRLFKINSKIYEIGSGSGYLIHYLAARGFNCQMTDLSDKRIAMSNAHTANLSVSYTDGVHLSRFAEMAKFDYLISDQVVEHIHPSDLITHFSEAKKLLKPGGEYIFRTPYALLGPADLSRVFGLACPVFMHLHEMTYADVLRLGRGAGFTNIKAILKIPGSDNCFRSGVYLTYLEILEKIAEKSRFTKKTILLGRKILQLRNNIFISLKN